MTLTNYLHKCMNTIMTHRAKTMAGMEISDRYTLLYGKKPDRKREKDWTVNDYPIQFLQDECFSIIMKHHTGRMTL